MLIDSATFFAFMLVVLTLQVIPGPAVILTITRSLSGGRRIGMATGLGIAVGDILHTLMAALGLSAILMTSALAFATVKYLGVAYLLFLGIRAMTQKEGTDHAARPANGISDRQAFRQAILAELLNPKTALFFLAFLPQFVHLGRGHVTLQLLVLGAIFVALSILVTSMFVLAAGSLRRLGSRLTFLRRWQGKIVGGIYLGLGLRLAAQQHS